MMTTTNASTAKMYCAYSGKWCEFANLQGFCTLTACCKRVIYNESPPQQGWVCPKCGRVNAPWVTTCGCVSSQTTATASTIVYKREGEEWKRIKIERTEQ